MEIAIIGGGAAGFFAAISAKEHFPEANVSIFEKSQKCLSKVKISGGGRCNVTNACPDLSTLAKQYPRGQHFLKKAFHQFSNLSTMQWFEERGVKLKVYEDGCVFPYANDSQVIIDCFMNEVKRLGIHIHLGQKVSNFEILDKHQLALDVNNQKKVFDACIVTIGGQPKEENLNWLKELGLNIISPLPSLFTFNIPNNNIVELMGNVVEKATVKVEGTKMTGNGPLLVTHWGLSGPAVILLSAWGARYFAEVNYNFAILVNWLNLMKEEALRTILEEFQQKHPLKMIGNIHPFEMTNRLWCFLLEKSNISKELRWGDLQGKAKNKFINTLLNDRYEVKGKTTFKEEFVTAGGIDLAEIDAQTMAWKKHPQLLFAGEVLDIDGVTGGFNFQAAWTTAWIAGKSCLSKI
jgi:hypothetical protein